MTEENQELTGIEWPDGWYIFEDGVITGPHKTKEAFNLQRQRSVSDEEILISRKGFSKWYEFGDLASIYQQADKTFLTGSMSVQEIEESLSHDIEKLSNLLKLVEKEAAIKIDENTTLDEVSSLETLQSQSLSNENSDYAFDTISEDEGRAIPVTKSKQQPLQKKKLGPETFRTEQNKSPFFNKNEIKDVANNAASGDLVKRKARRPQEHNSVGMRTKAAQVAEQAKNIPQSQVNIPTMQMKDQKSQLAYDHMMLAGRLRLGPLLSPSIEAYIKFIVSFGFYWGVWIRKSNSAVQMHLKGTANVGFMKSVAALIPVWHMVETYRLAKYIMLMEIQNGYKRTSPMLAVLFSILPPFAIAYLQSAMNAHWSLHVINSGKK